jgi:MFS family permease
MPSCEVRRFYGMFAASQFMVDSSIWSFFFTQTHNISLATAVAIHATTTIAAGAFDLPTGSWADRFGRRRIVLLGFVSRAIAAIMMVVAPSLPMFFLAAVLAGFGWAQLSGAAEALLHDNLKALGAESTFKHHMANVVITSYMSRTAAFGLSGLLFAAAPWAPYVVSALALCVGALFTSSIHEMPYERTNSTADLQHIATGITVYWSDSALRQFALVSLTIGIISEQLWFSLQPLLTHAQISPVSVGIIYAAGSVGSAFGAYAVKRLLSRHREDLALAGAVVLFGSGGLLFCFATEETLCLLAQFVTCIGFGASWTAKSSVLNAHIPSSHRAVCLSLLSAAGTTLQGMLGSGMGLAFDRFGPVAIPGAVALCAALITPATLRSVRRLKEAGNASSTEAA